MRTDLKTIPSSKGMELCTTGWFNATVKAWNTLALSVVNKEVLGAQFSTSFLACNVLSTTLASAVCRLSVHAVLENGRKKLVWKSAEIKITKKFVEKFNRKFEAVAASSEQIREEMEVIGRDCQLCASRQDIGEATTAMRGQATEIYATANQAVQRAQEMTTKLTQVQGAANNSLGRLTTAASTEKMCVGALNQAVETFNATCAEGHVAGEINTFLASITML